MVLRRRVVGGGDEGFLQNLKNFDAYAKPLDDFRVKTTSGATITLVSAITIFLLIISEFWDWTTVSMNPSLVVDKTRKEKMWINMNVTFHHIPCFLLSIDVMDVSGEHQNDVEHSIYKVRLDREGRVVDVTKGEVGDATKGADKALASQDPNYCGSCYGGQPPPSGCCNTCEEVRKSYTDKGWSFTSPESVEQCVREGWTEKLKEQQNEGCNMHGHIEVNKVAGNFHFAPGKSFTQANMHVHDLHSFAASADGDATTVGGGAQFDFSHTVHSLSFGKTMGFSNPLDGTYKKATKGFYMYQYFLKVVGTKFVFLNGTEVNTNQFSATEHERDLGGGKAGGMFGSSGLPGVFFNFDISPLQVIYTEYKKPLSHFLTDVCAIVGGIFTVAGIIDGFVYAAEKTLKKKLELGKAM